MNRRDYLRLQNLGLASLVIPTFDSDLSKKFSIEQLMGMESPKLF